MGTRRAELNFRAGWAVGWEAATQRYRVSLELWLEENQVRYLMIKATNLIEYPVEELHPESLNPGAIPAAEAGVNLSTCYNPVTFGMARSAQLLPATA